MQFSRNLILDSLTSWDRQMIEENKAKEIWFQVLGNKKKTAFSLSRIGDPAIFVSPLIHSTRQALSHPCPTTPSDRLAPELNSHSPKKYKINY